MYIYVCTLVTAGLFHLGSYILVENSGTREEDSHLPQTDQISRVLHNVYNFIFATTITNIMLTLIS